MRRLVIALTLLTLLMGASMTLAQDVVEIVPIAETEGVPGDGANGPAIWLHPEDLTMSTIIGTDDELGLVVFDLDGNTLQVVEDAPIANLDIRYAFPFGDEPITLVAGGVKDEAEAFFYTVNAETRELELLGSMELAEANTGLCLYRSPLSGAYHMFTVNEDGFVEQYELSGDGETISGELVREFNTGSETENCVADDDFGVVYFTDVAVAIWRYGAEPEDGTARAIVDYVGEFGNIEEETKGLTIYYAADGGGYLIASDESDDSFLVYERDGNAFVGEFQLVASAAVDEVTEPENIDVIGLPLGAAYPEGLFVTADDVNNEGEETTNFKMASFADIAAAFELSVDTAFDPRVAEVENVGVNQVAAVIPVAETDPVPSGVDAADDPAIWVHPEDTNLSTIIGTDKTGGMVVYDLDGTEIQYLPVGDVNNVDIRYNFPLGDELVALVTATNRTNNSLSIFTVNPETRELEDVASEVTISGVPEVYGTCMYLSPVSGSYYMFVTSTDVGSVEQWQLMDDGAGLVTAELAREMTIGEGTQTEGCVVDDELGVLYIGEEGVGIWKYDAEPDGSDEGTLVDSTDEEGNLTADVEGISLYIAGDEGDGYLIASSQGSSEFAVYERGGDNEYIGKFVVIEGDGVDGVSGSDGLDVTNFPLGDVYPEGVFVTQDDTNINPDENQNFKIVPWEAIAEALELEVDTDFDPRVGFVEEE